MNEEVSTSQGSHPTKRAKTREGVRIHPKSVAIPTNTIIINDSSDPPEEDTESMNDAEKSGLVRPKSPALSVAKSLPPSILKKNLKVGQIRYRIQLKHSVHFSIVI